MVSFELLLYCVLLGSGYLLALSLILDLLERRLHVTAGIPKEILESDGWIWTFMNFFMEALFYVVVPAIAFGFFYAILPVSGAKGGVGCALFAFVLGTVPLGMRLAVRIKLPMQYLLFALLSHLLKLAGTLAIIGYLYSL